MESSFDDDDKEHGMDAVGDNEQECVGELVNWMLLASRSGCPASRIKLEEYFNAKKRGRGFTMTKLQEMSEAILFDIFGFHVESTPSKPETVEEIGALNVANAKRKQRRPQKMSHFNLVYLPETEEDRQE